MRGNDYARWDDGWTRDPPEPPERPDLWEWRYRTSQQQIEAYYAALSGYLMAVCDQREWAYYVALGIDVFRERIGGPHDGPPARRRPWRGFRPR